MFASSSKVLPQSVLAEAGDPAVGVEEEKAGAREVIARVCLRRFGGLRGRGCQARLLACCDRRFGLCVSFVLLRRLPWVVRLVRVPRRRCGAMLATCVFV